MLGHNRVEVLDQEVRIAGATAHVRDGRLVTDEHREAVARSVVALATRVRERRAEAAA